MRFGMFTDFHVRKGATEAQAFEESFSLIAETENLGFDDVWLAEVHFTPGRAVLVSPLVVASAVAASTSKIRIGLAVQVLPLANPIRLAEEAATVDHISKGRFDFGIGRSDLTRWYQGYNIDYSESRGRFYEAFDIIKKAWVDEKLSYEGEFYSFHEVTVVPKPYQKPHPPIRVAVYSPETFEQMGSWGYPIFVPSTMDLPLLEERTALYMKAWREAGHPGSGDVVLRIPTYVAETTEKAMSEPEESAMVSMRAAAAALGSASGSAETEARIQRLASVTYDEVLTEKKVMYGTAEAVVDRLREYEDTLEITGIALELNYGGQIPRDRVLNSMNLVAERVIPQFK